MAKQDKQSRIFTPQIVDPTKSSLVKVAGQWQRVGKSPDEELGELFHDVQTKRVFPDGKTFTDLIPRGRRSQIKREYLLARGDPNFDLREFVNRHFYIYNPHKSTYHTNPKNSIHQHIDELWEVLERRNRRNRGSLVAVPYKYIVPGGRFNEQFYWDSYFIMLGLAKYKKWSLIDGMMKNYTYMLRKIGFIPTANRTYFLSRSQPPFFSHMVELAAEHHGRTVALAQYLPYMLIEYRFWMKGRRRLGRDNNQAFLRVAQLANGSLMNRYYDNKRTPRPESLREDTVTAAGVSESDADRTYLHLRAGAESGWDFSSRWFIDPNRIETVQTVDIIPVDLNSLLYHLEATISEAYRLLRQPVLSRRFMAAAEMRKKAILENHWNEASQFFEDYNFREERLTGRLTLAATFPLYVGIATEEQAAAVARKLEADFLKAGGLITTLKTTGQQWDAPNGWAPLHWVVIQGLRRYGFDELADEIKRRWVNTNLTVFKDQGKLVEKYDVVNPNKAGGGGEYPLQDGFGWTNGVLAALLGESRE